MSGATPRDVTPAGGARPQPDSRLGGLAHAATAAALVREADGTLLWVSDAWQRMFGFAADEAVGRHVSVVVAPVEHTPRERALDMTRALDAAGRWTGEVECVCKDGTRLWTATQITRFEDPGEGAVWVSVHVDVTAAHADRTAAATSVDRWHGVFEDAPVAMALVGPDLRMVDVNSRLCELTGYPRGELVDTSLATFLHPDDVPQHAELAARLRAGELDSYRLDLRIVDGAGASVRVTSSHSLVRGPHDRAIYEIAVLAEH
jgi:PAS domain S-box-containing protein